MEDRDFNEVDLRLMLQVAHGFEADVLDGRWVIRTEHAKRPWEVVVEPDQDCARLFVITADVVDR
jgi:hypothetical protein